MRQARTGEAAHRPRTVRRRRLATALVLAGGLLLGACAVQFGSGSDSPDQSSQKKPHDRNRLYWQEQEQLERQYQFDRVGPSDR
jgi:hypothetical protein